MVTKKEYAVRKGRVVLVTRNKRGSGYKYNSDKKKCTGTVFTSKAAAKRSMEKSSSFGRKTKKAKTNKNGLKIYYVACVDEMTGKIKVCKAYKIRFEGMTRKFFHRYSGYVELPFEAKLYTTQKAAKKNAMTMQMLHDIGVDLHNYIKIDELESMGVTTTKGGSRLTRIGGQGIRRVGVNSISHNTYKNFMSSDIPSSRKGAENDPFGLLSRANLNFKSGRVANRIGSRMQSDILGNEILDGKTRTGFDRMGLRSMDSVRESMARDRRQKREMDQKSYRYRVNNSSLAARLGAMSYLAPSFGMNHRMKPRRHMGPHRHRMHHYPMPASRRLNYGFSRYL